MINKDIHHMLGEAIKKEDPTKLYRVIQEHFKGGKNHHVEAATRKLSAYRFGPDIERDISRLLELISDLEIAQKMEMPESQKFGIMRTIMLHEDRAQCMSWHRIIRRALTPSSRKLRRVGCNTARQEGSSDGGEHGTPIGVSDKWMHKAKMSIHT